MTAREPKDLRELLILTSQTPESSNIIPPDNKRIGTSTLLYIRIELGVRSVAGKRPAPVKSDRLKEFVSRWVRAVGSQKFHLEKVRYARGVCKKPPISGHSGAG